MKRTLVVSMVMLFALLSAAEAAVPLKYETAAQLYASSLEADKAMADDDFEKAKTLAAFQLILEKNPSNADSLLWKGRTLAQLKKRMKHCPLSTALLNSSRSMRRHIFRGHFCITRITGKRNA